MRGGQRNKERERGTIQRPFNLDYVAKVHTDTIPASILEDIVKAHTDTMSASVLDYIAKAHNDTTVI